MSQRPLIFIIPILPALSSVSGGAEPSAPTNVRPKASLCEGGGAKRRRERYAAAAPWHTGRCWHRPLRPSTAPAPCPCPVIPSQSADWRGNPFPRACRRNLTNPACTAILATRTLRKTAGGQPHHPKGGEAMFWTLTFHIGRYSVSIRIMKLKSRNRHSDK